ncbi:MAG: hypothetical protein K8F91_17570, partial [Candidatus Obscuribacterales bacterium]|nr:hypothetical protein [Candidatus Obscuribacterales bacterium]
AMMIPSLFQGVYADTLKYEPISSQTVGSFKGSASVNKIGNLYSSDLTAFLDGNTLDIQEGAGDTLKTVARGVAFAAEVTKSANRRTLKGYWFCRDGSKLDVIIGTDKGADDIIDTKEGARFIGQIRNVTGSEINIDTKAGAKVVAVTGLKAVYSPKIFQFTCPLSGAASLDLTRAFEVSAQDFKFKPTFSKSLSSRVSDSRKTQAAKEPANSRWSTKKKIIVFTVLGLLVATAIAVPIAVAVPLANRNRRTAFQPMFSTQNSNGMSNVQQAQN